MIKIHDKDLRGHTRTGWLDSRHAFSFGSFNDPTRMGFGNLRVLNEDDVIPGTGFPSHAHDSMDILTLVLSGALRHEDDQGNVAEIRPGEIQLMSAGTGVTHSEWNASDTEDAHFLQIWLIPDQPGGAPSYHQAAVPNAERVTLAAGSGGLVPLRSRSRLDLVRVAEGAEQHVHADPAMLRYVHLTDGLALADGERVSAGDALQIPAGEAVSFEWQTDGAALLFEMPTPAPR